MGYETILLDRDGKVAILSFNRPQKKNAMNPKLHEEVTDALSRLRYDHGIAVLVITGEGDAFSSGMDLKEFFMDLKSDPDEFERINDLSTEWRGRTIRHFPKPTIAMVNGYCFGGALTIVESCDLALAADEATFGLNEINYKNFPAGSVTRALVNILRPRDFLWYTLTGKPFSGREAAEMGLVNCSVPEAQLRSRTLEVAHGIAAKDPSALRAAKETYRFSIGLDWDTAMNYSSAKAAEHVMRQNDAFRREGITDFLDGKYRPGLEAHDTRGVEKGSEEK
jgi:trans-feruloyl-CoA hydratase/vanillin synthase